MSHLGIGHLLVADNPRFPGMTWQETLSGRNS
jgi:hypothetical protein